MEPKTKIVLHILVAGLALGVLSDALLRAVPWGVNLTLWTALVLGATWLLAKLHKTAWQGTTFWIPLLLFVFAAGFAWRDAPGVKFLDVVAIALVVSLWSLSLETAPLRDRSILDYARGLLNSGAAAAAGAATLSKNDVPWSAAPTSGALRQARSAALGLLIAFPLLFIFGGLLMAADAVFDRMVTETLNFDFATLFSHAALAAFFAWIISGFLLLILKVRKPILADPLSIARPGLGIVEIAVPLALLDLLFLAFVLVQLRYLFGDSSLVQQTVGLTYAEYARRGFFELVAVAALVLPLLLLSDWVLAETQGRGKRIFRALAGVQLTLLSVIMASALKRMLLYQSAYGLTEQRVYTLAFMAWLGIVLVWFAVTVLRGQRRPFAPGAALAGLSLILALNFLNPDALIARVNVQRALAGAPFDAAYATSLSADAVPTLVSGLPSLRQEERCLAAAGILRRWSPVAEADWRTWNLGRARAWRIVREAEADLTRMACEEPAERPQVAGEDQAAP